MTVWPWHKKRYTCWAFWNFEQGQATWPSHTRSTLNQMLTDMHRRLEGRHVAGKLLLRAGA